MREVIGGVRFASYVLVRKASAAGSVSQVAQELGVNASILSRWRRDQAKPGKAFSGSGVPRDDEVAALRRELSWVKTERDFLRDAAAFFAKEWS